MGFELANSATIAGWNGSSRVHPCPRARRLCAHVNYNSRQTILSGPRLSRANASAHRDATISLKKGGEITRRDTTRNGKMNIEYGWPRKNFWKFSFVRSLTRLFVPGYWNRGGEMVYAISQQVWRKLELVFANRTSRHSYIPRETAHVHRRLPRCGGFVSAIVP